MADDQSKSPDHLDPPAREGQADPGAHDLSDDSEDHFSDAQSDILSPGPKSASKLKLPATPKTESDDTTSSTPPVPLTDDDDATKEAPAGESGEIVAETVPEATPEEAPEVEVQVEKAADAKADEDRESEPKNQHLEPEKAPETLPEPLKEADAEPEIQPKTEPKIEETTTHPEPEPSPKESPNDDQKEPEPEPESEVQLSFESVEPETSTEAEQQAEPDEAPVEHHVEPTVAEEEEEPLPSPLPGSFPVSETVLEESPSSVPPRSPHVEHTQATDAAPDLVLRPKEEAEELGAETEKANVEFEESETQEMSKLEVKEPKTQDLSKLEFEELEAQETSKLEVEESETQKLPKFEELKTQEELPKLEFEKPETQELPKLEFEVSEPQSEPANSTVDTNVKQAPTSPLASPLDPPKSPRSPSLTTPKSPRLRRKSSRHMQSPVAAESLAPPLDLDGADDDFDDDFGDFDDFEEGGGGDDDFGDFDDAAFQTEPVAAPVATPAPVSPAPPASVLPFPIPDFEGLDEDEVPDALDPYMNLFFPPETLDVIDLPPLTKENTSFLTQRSASLWSQLVAPPPLAPPDWIRSRIRRLFLVSLGVPVDLDEILPASKQKKLVLPSLAAPSAKSPRVSSDARAKRTAADGSSSSAAGGSGSGSGSGSQTPTTAAARRRGEKTAPELDLVSAKQLCAATDEALAGMTMDELQAHLDKLQALQGAVAEALEYWKKTTDEKIAERDALEGVIENLVKHARKVRK